MARVYSAGKEAKEGGDWGWIGRDILRKELNEIAFTLKPGQHSRLIDTDEGYHILQVDDAKPAHTTPLAEVRDLGILMHMGADAVADKLFDHAEAFGFHHLLHRRTDIPQRSAGTDCLDGPLQRPLRDIEQPGFSVGSIMRNV